MDRKVSGMRVAGALPPCWGTPSPEETQPAPRAEAWALGQQDACLGSHLCLPGRKAPGAPDGATPAGGGRGTEHQHLGGQAQPRPLPGPPPRVLPRAGAPLLATPCQKDHGCWRPQPRDRFVPGTRCGATAPQSQEAWAGREGGGLRPSPA